MSSAFQPNQDIVLARSSSTSCAQRAAYWVFQDSLFKQKPWRRTLRPICSAQQVSTDITCGAPAVAVAEVHAIDECNQMGLNPDGDLVETLCQACLVTVQWAMDMYVRHTREMASRCGTRPACTTCGRPTGYLRSVFAVRPIGPEGLAS